MAPGREYLGWCHGLGWRGKAARGASGQTPRSRGSPTVPPRAGPSALRSRRASSPTTCGCAKRSSAASSIVMTRSCVETKDDNTPRRVVLPELVPPEFTMFIRARTQAARNADGFGWWGRPHRLGCVEPEERPPERCCFDDWVDDCRRRARKRGTGSAVTDALLAALIDVGLVGRTVLDVGCGIGDLAIEAVVHGATRARGYDLSTKAIEEARELARDRGVADRTRFEVGDGAKLDLPAADVVAVNRVVCCYPDADGLLERSLAATGSVYAIIAPISKGLTGLFNRVLNPLGNVVYRAPRSEISGVPDLRPRRRAHRPAGESGGLPARAPRAAAGRMGPGRLRALNAANLADPFKRAGRAIPVCVCDRLEHPTTDAVTRTSSGHNDRVFQARHQDRFRLHARAKDVGLLARGAPQRAIPVRAGVQVVLVVFAGDGSADRALPAVREAAALRAEQRRLYGHHPLRADSTPRNAQSAPTARIAVAR